MSAVTGKLSLITEE